MSTAIRTLTVVAVSNGVNGSVSINDEGFIDYAPNIGFEGIDSFTYTVSDGETTTTATAQVQIDNAFAGWRQGSERRDFLFGNRRRENRIFGRGGNDFIFGNRRTDYLAGGDGNDIIFGRRGNDHLWGNAGDDLILGGSGFDTAYFAGTLSEYTLNTSFGNFFIRTRDDAPNVNGNDGRDQLISIERLSFFGGETLSVVSPIILDLDGGGVETVSAADSDALFDLDEDGIGDDTSWIGAGEGLLFFDRDGDGTVSGVSELSFIDDVPDARSDLEGLRAFDSNADGVFSAADDEFANFGVWQDRNSDGVVDAGEILSLETADVVEIGLTGTAVESSVNIGEVAVINTGSFVRSDGSNAQFLDAALTYFSTPNAIVDTMSFDSMFFARRAKRYRLHSEDGVLMIGSKRVATENLGGAMLLNFNGTRYGLASTIVLDLDGDGIELSNARRSGVSFDHDGNGANDATGWVTGGDGILVIDRNGDGRITSSAEMNLFADNPDARNQIEALSGFDNNGDGVLDSQDVRFNELQVWVDGNGNGITDEGELRSLQEVGITSFDLTSQGTDERRKIRKNITVATASFTRTDGSISTFADVALSFQPAESGGSLTNAGVSALGFASADNVGAADRSNIFGNADIDAQLYRQVPSFGPTEFSPTGSTAPNVAGIDGNNEPAAIAGSGDLSNTGLAATAFGTRSAFAEFDGPNISIPREIYSEGFDAFAEFAEPQGDSAADVTDAQYDTNRVSLAEIEGENAADAQQATAESTAGDAQTDAAPADAGVDASAGSDAATDGAQGGEVASVTTLDADDAVLSSGIGQLTPEQMTELGLDSSTQTDATATASASSTSVESTSDTSVASDAAAGGDQEGEAVSVAALDADNVMNNSGIGRLTPDQMILLGLDPSSQTLVAGAVESEDTDGTEDDTNVDMELALASDEQDARRLALMAQDMGSFVSGGGVDSSLNRDLDRGHDDYFA